MDEYIHNKSFYLPSDTYLLCRYVNLKSALISHNLVIVKNLYIINQNSPI